MAHDNNSRWPGFYKLSLEERLARISKESRLRPETREHLGQDSGLPARTADQMVENCIGTFGLPFGLGLNLRVDGVDRVVPMAIEEPSVVAGLGRAARLLRSGPGITSERSDPVMIGQIQILDVPDPAAARERLLCARSDLLEQANALDPVLLRVGGGARDLEVRLLPPEGPDDPVGMMLVVHLLVDVRDAMGANVVNTMCERLAPRVADLTGGRALLRILSNLADRRLVTVTGRVALDRLILGDGGASGRQVAQAVQEASVFAERDPYRAATHNKGIMNGVDAVLVALGQDWRAVEAGAHAYAARSGRYRAMTRWRVEGDDLVGTFTLPLAVGTVGGVTREHPTVRAAFDLTDVRNAKELSALVAAVGLAQNLAALLALVTHGIQRGHMRLHARKLGAALGATDLELDPLFDELYRRGCWSEDSAREVLADLRAAPSGATLDAGEEASSPAKPLRLRNPQ